MFQGSHLDDHTPFQFDGITFRLGHFAKWIARSGVRTTRRRASPIRFLSAHRRAMKAVVHLALSPSGA